MHVSSEWVYRIEYTLDWGTVWGQTGFVVSSFQSEEDRIDKSIV